jgi:hypothetical protein
MNQGSLANTFAFAPETREKIRKGFARVAFASEWADAIDNYNDDEEKIVPPIGCRYALELPNLSGVDIYDVCPFDLMPEGYVEHAEMVIRETEDANGKGIVAICHALTETPRDEMPDDDEADCVGHYLYQSAVGAGVGLWDKFSETGGEAVKVPDNEGPYLVTTGNLADYV